MGACHSQSESDTDYAWPWGCVVSDSEFVTGTSSFDRPKL